MTFYVRGWDRMHPHDSWAVFQVHLMFLDPESPVEIVYRVGVNKHSDLLETMSNTTTPADSLRIDQCPVVPFLKKIT
jgi:hypothetical protein